MQDLFAFQYKSEMRNRRDYYKNEAQNAANQDYMGKTFDPATVLTMPIPELQDLEGYYYASD